jgi:hypothetical protein
MVAEPGQPGEIPYDRTLGAERKGMPEFAAFVAICGWLLMEQDGSVRHFVVAVHLFMTHLTRRWLTMLEEVRHASRLSCPEYQRPQARYAPAAVA